MDVRIVQAINYVEAQLQEKLDLKQLAALVYLSPYHFHRLFKRETGLPFKQFVESLKIEKAFQMMLKPNCKVQDLAEYLGYNDSETFSRAFKRRYKIAPGDLRQVVLKAVESLQAELDPEKQCIIVAFKADSPEAITQRIMQGLRQSNLGTTVLDEVQAFSLETRPLADSGAGASDYNIRKKFRLKAEPQTSDELKNRFNSG